MSQLWQLSAGLSAAVQRRFASLDAVFALEGEPITAAPMSDVIKVTIEGTAYYVKRYYAGGKGLRRYLGRSRLRGEIDNLQLFQSLDIPTPRITAYGSQSRCGVFQRGALITQSLDGCIDLMHYCQTPLQTEPALPFRLRAKQPWRAQLISQLANYTARLHRIGFVHNDLKWRNVLVDPHKPGQLFLMDCPVGRIVPSMQRRRGIVKDLACLDKYAPQYFSRTERLRFFKQYLNASSDATSAIRDSAPLTANAKNLIRAVLACSQKIFHKKYQTLLADNRTDQCAYDETLQLPDISFRGLWTAECALVDERNQRGSGWSEVGTLTQNDGSQVYIKRQHNFLTRDRHHGLRAYPVAAREYRNLQAFKQLEIPSLHPCYFAIQRQGRQQRAILITQSLVDYQDLQSFMDSEAYQAYSTACKTQFIDALAQQIAHLHNCGFVHNCLYPKHILIKPLKSAAKETSHAWDIRFIDLEKAYRPLWRLKNQPLKKFARDLDTLKRRTKNYSELERIRFLKAYLHHRQITDKRFIDFVPQRVLRSLPSKRLVVQGHYQNQPAVAKIYFGDGHIRYWQREQLGITTLQRAGCNTPQVLDAYTSNVCSVLILSYLEDAKPLSHFTQTAPNNSLPWLTELATTLYQQHRANVLQTDAHLDNFVVSKAQLYCLDGDGVRAKPLTQSHCLKHLALVLAQYPITQTPKLFAAWQHYHALQGWEVTPSEYDKHLLIARQQRLKRYGKKVFRRCSEFFAQQTLRYRIIYHRAHCPKALRNLLCANDPALALDTLIEQAVRLKDGNSATVVSTRFNDHPYVIKRYNIKHWRHALLRAFQPTRAATSWYFGHILKLAGIPTAQPVALIEQRFGPIRRTAYWVCTAIDASSLQHTHSAASKAAEPAVLTQCQRTLKQLHDLQLSHGDTKLTNFIVHQNTAHVIDLDAMRWHVCATRFKKAKQRDLTRFEKNWQTSKKS